jgi:hypothetical protein
MAQREAAGEGAEAFSKAFSEFTRLSGIINDSNAGVKRQEDAFKQLNSELAKYGLEIESITAFQKVGIQVGSLYAKIKQEEAKSSLFAAEAAEQYKQQIILQKKAQQGDLLGAFGDLKFADQLKVGAKTLTATTLAFVGGVGALKTVFETSVAKGVGGTVKALAESEKDFNNEAAKSEKEITNLVNQLDKLDGVNEKTAKTTAKTTEETIRKTAALKAKNVEVQKEISFEDQLLARVKAREAAEKSAQAIAGLDSLRANSATLAGEPQTASLNIGNLTTKLNAQTAALAANSEAYVKNANDIKSTAIATQNAAIAADVLSGVFNSAFQALSQGESPIQAITQSLKQLIVRLAAAAATAAVLSLILGGITGGAPVIAGAASNSFGGIFKSLLGLASGGIASRPTPALIGDGGPEAVIPLSQLANIIGGVAMQMGGGGGGNLSIVRGQDIYYSNNNASRSFGRLFG